MARRRKHKKSSGRIVTSKSGRKYRKSPSSRTGWTLVKGAKHHKKRKATKRRKHSRRRR